MMTVVVPSPTSSSWVRLLSIMLFAAGCETSISRRIACPSFVKTMPPMGSSSIFSMALGPRHDRMMSATLGEFRQPCTDGGPTSLVTHVFAAVMFDICAFLPNCRSPFWVSVKLVRAVHLAAPRCFTHSALRLGPASLSACGEGRGDYSQEAEQKLDFLDCRGASEKSRTR